MYRFEFLVRYRLERQIYVRKKVKNIIRISEVGDTSIGTGKTEEREIMRSTDIIKMRRMKDAWRKI